MRLLHCSLAAVSLAFVAPGLSVLTPSPDARPPPFVPVETRSIDTIYAAALRERGTLRVSWGGDEKNQADTFVAAFTARFPGISINATVDLSKYHDSRADRTFQVSNGKDDGTDIAQLQTVQDFVRWKNEKRLLPYKVITWNDIQKSFVDQDGAFTGAFIFQFGTIVFNPNKVANSTVPAAYDGFLKPEFVNKLVLTYPNDDDAILFLFKRILDTFGFGFIDSLLQQNVTWVRGSATPTTLIARPASQNQLAASFAAAAIAGPTVSTIAPTDPFISWPQTAAIFATTKLPETAKLYMNFLMSDEWQQVVSAGGFATRKKFDTLGILRQKLTNPLDFVAFMNDRPVVERLKLQFETIIGTAQGLSPLDDGI